MSSEEQSRSKAECVTIGGIGGAFGVPAAAKVAATKAIPYLMTKGAPAVVIKAAQIVSMVNPPVAIVVGLGLGGALAGKMAYDEIQTRKGAPRSKL
jgi:hypothetical protein